MFRNIMDKIRLHKPPKGYQQLTMDNIKKMDYDQKRGFSVMIEHPMIAIFTMEIIDYFKAAGGVNFVSFCAWDAEIGEIEITVRPKARKTKTQIIKELKKEIKELKVNASTSKTDQDS